MSDLPVLPRNPFAAKAAAVLRQDDGGPWQGRDEVELAKAYALIGLTDELRRANQIAVARATGDEQMLAATAHAIGSRSAAGPRAA